ncbi:DUF6266 family protein [Chryseobacterium gotjawalense]|uniref:DUF6266 family protein n=1 Tax=Chryseobacterium gotjawalense TaxID=3042315 RepID=A0ABY8RBW0_9FLAO|nr:DUF6266 family protein [Chryseobacterium sp. wdc7]WHF51448.1 DUF6266 family protein [Chryseobacterium sp. wdc7]
MGKLIDSLLAGSSGRVGRVVVANMFGNDILKHRPRRKQKTPTAKQLLIQDRMKKSYAFMGPYKEFAKRHYGVRIGMKSPYNLAMTNVMNAFKLDFILLEITPAYSEIEFAKGPLTGAIPTGLTSDTPSTFTLVWYDNSGSVPLREIDQLQVLFIAEGESKPIFMENVAMRADTTIDIQVPPNLQGKTVHVWMAFLEDDFSRVSTSSYAGNVLIT